MKTNQMNQRLRLCSIHKSKRAGTFSRLAIGAIAIATTTAAAGSLVVKPGTRNTFAPEFGRTIARSTNYTVAAALQESVFKPGETNFQNLTITLQGAVYLFNDNSSTPERVYQYPGNAHFNMQAGNAVAISDKWMAFASGREGADPTRPEPGAVYIVGKPNGQWSQCPTVNGAIDCSPITGANGAIPAPAIAKIPFSRSTMHWTETKIAISDNTLAMADLRTSQLSVFRFNATSRKWIQEFFANDTNYKYGDLAIDGDRIAVTATSYNGGQPVQPGYVRILQRNAANGSWSYTALSYGYFSNAGFGDHLSMQGGNLVVGGSGVLAFYKVGTDGTLSSPYVVSTPASTGGLTLSGNTMAATTSDTSKPVVLYKRDSIANTNSWKATRSLDGHLFQSRNFNGYTYYGANPIALNGNSLSLGWHSYGVDKDNTLIGAFIREQANLIDECKTPGNLVQNCSFDIPTSTAWQLLTWQGASAYPTYTNGEMTAAIYNPGSDFWHIQARTPVKIRTAGTHTLKFRARSSGARTISVSVGHNGTMDNNWTSYGRATATLGPNMTDYSFDLASVPADTNCVLDFNMGNAGTQTVVLDGVNLAKRP